MARAPATTACTCDVGQQPATRHWHTSPAFGELPAISHWQGSPAFDTTQAQPHEKSFWMETGGGTPSLAATSHILHTP